MTECRDYIVHKFNKMKVKIHMQKEKSGCMCTIVYLLYTQYYLCNY